MAVSQTASPAALREISGFTAIIAILMLFAAGKVVLYDTMDPDFFWHIRVAEQLQHEGIKPLVDQLSFSTIKTPWTPYSWLAELGMKEIYDRTGMRGAIIVQAILQATFILLITLCALQRPSPHAAAERTRAAADSDNPIFPLMPVILSVAFASFLSLPYLSFRPVLGAIDVLALCAFFLLRDRAQNDRSRLIWFIPALTALTINLHIFAVFIPLWVGALMVGAWIERDRRSTKRYGRLLMLCTIGCCCTPMLPGTIRSILDYATSNPFTANSMIAELEPMYRGTTHQLTLCIVLLLTACAIAKRTLRNGEWLWLAGMLVLWIKCGRAAPILAPIFVAMMARSLPTLSDRVLGAKWVNVGTAAILLVGVTRLALSLPSIAQPEAWLNRHGPDLPGYPTAAAEYVDANIHRSTGKLINEFDWGGYLSWKLPEYQVLLDGRTQLYPPAFWRTTYLDDKRETTNLLESTEADAAILPIEKSRFRDSLQQLGWKRVFCDTRAEVFIPPTSFADLNPNAQTRMTNE